jgi:Sodium:dicarboxylate symporter family
MPIILLLVIALISLLHPWIPPVFQSLLYGISLSLKSIIVFALPFLIFGLLFKTAVQLSKKASRWALFLLIAICLSNFLSTLISSLSGAFAYSLDMTMALPETLSPLIPIGAFSLPKLIGNGQAMLAGLLLGILCGRAKPQLAEKIAGHFEKAISCFLKAFLFIIPLFIAGFIIKMRHDGVMGLILRHYSLIFLLVAASVFTYIALLYFLANGCRIKPFVKSLKMMLPAAAVGFGTMSSAAAMPLTILAAEKNG